VTLATLCPALVAADGIRSRSTVTTVGQLDAALARLKKIKVREMPVGIYRRDGYTRSYHHRSVYLVTPEQRSIPLVGDKPVGDFLSPELRFPHSWLYERLKVPEDGDAYMLLDRRVLLKLLRIVNHLSARGYAPGSFFIISAHRTERVNRYLYRFRMRTWGRTSLAKRSLHLLGRALDLIIGDLNRDGRVDVADHRAMVCAIISVERRYPRLRGGLGLYARSVHTDVRGRRASWCGKGGNRGPLCRERRRLRCPGR
jgi:hypothetical protein